MCGEVKRLLWFEDDRDTLLMFRVDLADYASVLFRGFCAACDFDRFFAHCQRSEEHTSELQSQSNLVCRLLLEKKKIQHLCRGTKSRTQCTSASRRAVTSVRSREVRSAWQDHKSRRRTPARYNIPYARFTVRT